MVNFSCNNCGQKLKAPDKFYGRRVKCPKCSSVCVVPEMPAKIRFLCKSCGKKISVPEVYAGKKGKCPKCKSLIVVPRATGSSVTADRHTSDVKISPKNTHWDGLLLDTPQKREVPAEMTEQDSTYEDLYGLGQTVEQRLRAEQDEQTGERKLPWLIDIFLYPVSVPGLINLAIFIGVPLLVSAVMFLLGPLAFTLTIPIIIVNILIRLYMYWYFAECIRDSGVGGLRAPETLGNSPDLGDMFSQTISIVACIILFLGPVGFYHLFIHKTDLIYWILLGYGVFFFPMGLLAVVMFNSSSGFNPFVIIGSIFSTFFQYCGLIIVFCGFGLLTQIGPGAHTSRVLAFIFFCGNIYLIMVAAHLLGRFYWRYQEKLNWEV